MALGGATPRQTLAREPVKLYTVYESSMGTVLERSDSALHTPNKSEFSREDIQKLPQEHDENSLINGR